MSNLYPVLAQPAFHLRADFLEMLAGARLEAHHQYRLSIGCANQSPAVAEQYSHAVDVDHLVLRRKIFCRLRDDAELLVVRTWNSQLGRRDEARNICEHFVNTNSGISDDSQQARGAVECVVESVVTFRKEHVTGHLTRDRCTRLVHFFLDQ